MPTYQYADLDNPLKGFEDADTNSQAQGFVPAGEYKVIEYKQNFPNPDTDYVHIYVPAFGDEETWICSRWKTNQYATIVEREVASAPIIDFSQEPLSVEENQLTDLLPAFSEFTYDLDQGRYPYPLLGFKTPVAPPFTNNCCTFVEGLVVKAWQNAHPDFKWSLEEHKQMMIYSSDDYFSPVTCLVNTGIAKKTSDADQSPHPWTVIQGWRKQWTSGHTFMIVRHHVETDRVLTLESNSSYKLNGVGYRNIGSIKEYPSPPVNWWEDDQLWTWERVKSIYRFREQCALKVKELTWAQG